MPAVDKKGRGTLSSPDDPFKPLFEVDYHIHIEENDEPPVRPGVEVRAIKWAEAKPGRDIPNGKYVLTDEEGCRHLLTCTHSGQGWSYEGSFFVEEDIVFFRGGRYVVTEGHSHGFLRITTLDNPTLFTTRAPLNECIKHIPDKEEKQRAALTLALWKQRSGK